MVATSASGTNAVRYGTMKENVINLEIVLPDGSILHTAGPNRRSRKSVAGYNLTELFIGSEGTLGIITKATLRLHAVPEVMIAAVSAFKSIHDAVSAVVEILQNNIPVARIELLDELSVAISNEYSNLNYPVSPCLFFEFHGSEEVVKVQTRQVEDIIKSSYDSNFIWAQDPDSRNKLWHARHQIYYATLAQKPGHKCMVTDVCVPISKLTEMVVKTQEDIKHSKILGSIIGHVGDGNFHTQLLFDPQNEKEIEAAHAVENKITMRALSLSGTCTGEHGIGIGKIAHLETEYGKVGIQAMISIKKAFDPLNIMNPGKVIKLPES